MRAQEALTLGPPRRFIGRSDEIEVLGGALTAAKRGSPALVLISGEPGIGKTRLVKEFSSRAEREGWQVVAGRFTEDQSVPYRAIATAIVPQLDRAGLLNEAVLGAGAAALRQVGGLDQSGPVDDPTVRPGPLHLALGRGLLRLSERRPLLLVIDDLQWADREAQRAITDAVYAVLEAAEREPVRAVLVLVHRPLPASDPLASQLARLARETATIRMVLRGLDNVEVHELVTDVTGRKCSRPLLGVLHEGSRGNPLFLTEALRGLAEQGALRIAERGLVSTASVDDLPLPIDVTSAVERNVAALSPSIRERLALAALADDEFRESDLGEIAGNDGLTALQSALETQLIAEAGGGSYRFTHPVVRRVLHDRLPPGQRRKAHAAIASQLIAASAPAARIAYHLVASGKESPAEVVGPWCQRAGRETFGAQAWSQAARYYDAALEAAGWVVELDEGSRAELYLAAGIAHYRDNSLERCRSLIDEAIQYARLAEDPQTWARALEFLAGFDAYGGDTTDVGREIQLFVEGPGKAHPASVALVLSKQAGLLATAGDAAGATEVASRAASLALEVNAPEALNFALKAAQRAAFDTLDMVEVMRLDAELARIAPRLRDAWSRGHRLLTLPSALLAMGRIEEAWQRAQEARESFAAADNLSSMSLAVAVEAALAAIEGRFDLCEATALESQRLVQRTGYVGATSTLYRSLLYARALRGRPREALDALARFGEAPDGRPSRLDALLVDAYCGRPVPPEPGPGLERPVVTAGEVFRAAIRTELGWGWPGDLEVINEAVRRGMRFVNAPPLQLQRIAARALHLAGQPEKALQRSTAAITEARAIGARAELANGLVDRARIACALGDREEARAAMREAVQLYEELGFPATTRGADLLCHDLGIEPPAREARLNDLAIDVLAAFAGGQSAAQVADALLVSVNTVQAVLDEAEREQRIVTPADAHAALERLDLLRAEPTPAEPGAAREELAIMFTDIVDSTPTNAKLGDAAWAALVERYNAATSAAVTGSGGRVVKLLGDGALAAFAEPAQAVAAAAELQAVALTGPDRNVLGGRVRVGLHAGLAVEQDGDILGIAVTVASRICGLCQGGEILASAGVAESLRGTGPALRDRGRRYLKGIHEPIRLYAVVV